MDKTLAERRTAMHMSQMDMAVKLEVTVSTWQRWEKLDPVPAWLHRAVKDIERDFAAQPHASQLDRGQAAPGRPATSSRAIVRNSNTEIQHYFLPDSATALLPEQRRALPEGTLVWIFGDKWAGWYPARMRGIFGRALGDPSIPDNEREPYPPVPAWLQPIIDACPITKAMRERAAQARAGGMFNAPPPAAGVVPVAAAPAWMLSQADEQDE